MTSISEESTPDFPIPSSLAPLALKDVAFVPSNTVLNEILTCCSRRCQRIPPPGSYACEAGHLTCFECLKPNLQCFHKDEDYKGMKSRPCGKRLTKERPCFLHTILFNSCTVTCPRSPLCQFTGTGEQLQKHKLTCIGTENLECWLNEAHMQENENLFTLHTLMQHLEMDHGIRHYENCHGMVAHKFDDWIMQGNETAIPFVIKHDDGNFRFICVCRHVVIGQKSELIIVLYCANLVKHKIEHHNKTDREFIATVEFIGERKEAAENKKNPNPLWKGSLPDIKVDFMDAVKNATCLVVPSPNGPAAPSGNILVRIEV